MHLVDIECPHCGAVGHVEDAPRSPCLMGRCPVCGGHVLYFCGTVLPLEEDVIDSRSLPTIRDHIMNQIDEFLEDRVTHFLEAYAKEFDIQLDAAESPAPQPAPVAEEADDFGDEEEEAEIEVVLEDDEEYEDIHPSIRYPERGAITSEELRDFVDIDLHLIDKAWYFERYFSK